jgi:Thioester domain
MSLGISGVAAAEEPVTGIRGVTVGVSVVDSHGGSGVEWPVGLITLKIGDKVVTAYCINNGIMINSALHKETTWDSAHVPDLDHIHWALLHGWPTVSADKLLEAAGATRPDGISDARLGVLLYTGTQAAVWHFSNPDNFQLGAHTALGNVPSATEYAVIVAVHDYLTGSKNTGKPEPVTLKIDPATATGQVGTKVGPYTVHSGVGPIDLTATGGKLVDENGNPVTSLGDGGKFWVTSETVGDATIDAKGSAQVGIGRVFEAADPNINPNASQRLILAGFAGEPVEAQAKATFTPKPALPVTGPAAAGAALAGLLLVGIGFALVIAVRRRRRVEFIA